MAVIRVDKSGYGFGTSRSDTIYGNSGVNIIYGDAGNDRIHGNGGNDFLSGEEGRDTLTGGAGSDDFHFGTRPPKTAVDIITDFDKRYDSILLSDNVFKGIGRPP